jgi:hypothetical protein
MQHENTRLKQTGKLFASDELATIQIENQTPIDHSHLDRSERLELLVGHLADLLTPARELVSNLKLRSNAAHTTRSDLAVLNELAGTIWERLGDIRDEIKALKQCQDQL